MTTVAEILTVARSWIGTKFEHQGRQKGIRCDCIGLVIEVCREVGLIEGAGLPADWNHRDYGRFPESYTPSLPLLAYLRHVPLQAMRAGDIALFRVVTGIPAHMGFLGDASTPCSLIHALCARTPHLAKVQEHRLSTRWLRAMHSVYRLPLEET